LYENLKCLKPVLIVRHTEIRAGEPQGPESSVSKFETGFEKMKRYKSLVSGKNDPIRKQNIRL
jgi:hypothetical protein